MAACSVAPHTIKDTTAARLIEATEGSTYCVTSSFTSSLITSLFTARSRGRELSSWGPAEDPGA